MANNTNEMLPGFYLTIEDTGSGETTLPNVKDVIVIYCNIPEIMKYEDEDGEVYDKFIEPNKPLLIAKSEDAIRTLELTGISLTREVQNLLRLLPTGVNIALCRIVKKDGESPNPTSNTEMREAILFALQSTENYPIKEMYFTDMSLDRVLSITNGYKEILDVTEKAVNSVGEVVLLEKGTVLYTDIENVNGQSSVSVDVSANVQLQALVSGASKDKFTPFNNFEFLVNGVAGVFLDSKGAEVPAKIEMQYVQDTTNHEITSSVLVSPANLGLTVTVEEKTPGNLTLNIKGGLRLKVTDEHFIEMPNELILDLLDDGRTDVNKVERTGINEQIVTKLSASSDMLTDIMKHNYVITTTMNNCMTFLSPEPPKNPSNAEIAKYVDKCASFYEKIRSRIGKVIVNGKAIDLGFYLNVPVGSNQVDGIGGLVNFPQSTVSTITVDTNSNTTKITTKKNTESFEENDVVEIFTYEKLNINTIKTKVLDVKLDNMNATEITVEGIIDLGKTKSPIYISNVNNKDFNGNYLSVMYSNLCREAGVKISPTALVMPGQCQMTFNAKQLNLLDSKKFAVLNQVIGTNSGKISRSQIMTDPATQRFQDHESVAVVYSLNSGTKDIAMKYKGQRVDDTDVAIIQKEMDDAVFKPAVGSYITSTYKLSLRTAMLSNPNGKKEKALFIDYTVTEIQTLALIRIVARLY